MKQAILNNPNKSTVFAIAAVAMCIGMTAQAQVIDTLTGSLAGYTTTLANDVSHGAGNGILFTDSGSGLSASYIGTGTTPEQAFFLAPASSFSTTFAVGDMFTVDVSMPVSANSLDFGLAIASTATPTAASAGTTPNAWDSRNSFDWASISVRPSQASVRGGEDISGAATSTGFNIGAAADTVSKLYIQWVSADVFNLGYYDTSAVQHQLFSATFAGASTIGTAIGFYSDERATGSSLGNFSNLTISVPEPSTLALGGMGIAGLLVWKRRK